MRNINSNAATLFSGPKIKFLSAALLSTTMIVGFAAPANAQNVVEKIHHVIYCSQLLVLDALNGTNFHTEECGIGEHFEQTSRSKGNLIGMGTSTAPAPTPVTPEVVEPEVVEPEEVVDDKPDCPTDKFDSYRSSRPRDIEKCYDVPREDETPE